MTKSKFFDQERQIAIEAIIKAAYLGKKVQAEMIKTGAGSLQKQDRSPVTIADFGSQAIICRYLQRAFPEDQIVAEENSSLLKNPENSHLLQGTVKYVEEAVEEQVGNEKVCDWIDLGNGRTEERFWTLDPVDGTKGFLRGDQYAVALALIVQGQVKLGLLACPNLPSLNLEDQDSETSNKGMIYWAVAGEGAGCLNLEGKEQGPLRVSDRNKPSDLQLIESFESGHSNHQIHERIASHLGITRPVIRMDSQAKYGLIASGAVDAYLRFPSSATPDYREKIWDHAAGSLIVKEAGGMVSDIYGRSLDFSQGKKLSSNQGILASNGKVHQMLVESLSQQGIYPF